MENSISDKKLISIVIPCYRSEKTIKNVVDEIDETFSKQSKYDYEAILVNDGSSDNTFGVISAICEVNPRVTGIDLAKNFGQVNATMAGMQYAHGDFMVTMDDDGQHPAEGIFTLVEKVQEGFDLVYANFQNKKHSLFKRVTSKISDKIIVLLGNRKTEYHVSTFIGFSKFAIKAIQSNHSPVAAGAIYVRNVSNKVTSVPINHRERITGKSNYSLKLLFRQMRRSMTNFSTKLLDFSYKLGVFALFMSFACGVGMIISKILNPEISVSIALVICIMLLLAGLIMILIGVLGDYIGKIYLIEIKKPNYYIRHEHLNMFAKNKQEMVEGNEQ